MRREIAVSPVWQATNCDVSTRNDSDGLWRISVHARDDNRAVTGKGDPTFQFCVVQTDARISDQVAVGYFGSDKAERTIGNCLRNAFSNRTIALTMVSII